MNSRTADLEQHGFSVVNTTGLGLAEPAGVEEPRVPRADCAPLIPASFTGQLYICSIQFINYRVRLVPENSKFLFDKPN